MQVVMIGFHGSTIPDEVRDAIDDLRDSQDVRLVDALCLTRDTSGGGVEQRDLPDLKLTEPASQGAIRSLLNEARSRTMLTGQSLSGPPANQRGVLFRAEPLPDPRDVIPRGSQAVVLLLEHRWGARLRHTVGEVGGYPIASNWLNAAAVQEVGHKRP
jgi:hypothetical protein